MTMNPTAILTAALLCALSPISFAVAGEIWVSPSGHDSSTSFPLHRSTLQYILRPK
jgi:hypothetical protein